MLNSLFYPPNSPPLALALAVQEITFASYKPFKEARLPNMGPRLLTNRKRVWRAGP